MQLLAPAPEAKALYKKRSHLAETPFAMMKHNLGVRQLLHRGLDGARGEVNLVATAVNLLKCVLNWSRVQKVLT